MARPTVFDIFEIRYISTEPTITLRVSAPGFETCRKWVENGRLPRQTDEPASILGGNWVSAPESLVVFGGLPEKSPP